jgi:hypothetical protein
MKKLNIKLVLVGHLRNSLDLPKLRRFNSRFFRITEVERIDTLPNPQKDDGFLDVVYSRDEITRLMNPVNGSDLIVGIINYRFDDNFYLHRTGKNKACISIADIDRLLIAHNISLENFILKNIFEMVVFVNTLGELNTDKVYDFVHQDTRGCLFDLNGDKLDVVHNTEHPKICDSCKAMINSKSVPDNFTKQLESELQRIRKPYVCSIELFIKKYPLFSLLVTFLFGILINIISNMIWKLLT